MRMFLAIMVCKLLRFIGKLVGKGSSLPGQYALNLCPDVLGRVKLPPCVIAVTGSNGKTSTVEMIAAILRSQGKQVVYNAEGSNQIEGVTTLILSHCTLGGRMKGDVLPRRTSPAPIWICRRAAWRSTASLPWTSPSGVSTTSTTSWPPGPCAGCAACRGRTWRR